MRVPVQKYFRNFRPCVEVLFRKNCNFWKFSRYFYTDHPKIHFLLHFIKKFPQIHRKVLKNFSPQTYKYPSQPEKQFPEKQLYEKQLYEKQNPVLQQWTKNSNGQKIATRKIAYPKNSNDFHTSSEDVAAFVKGYYLSQGRVLVKKSQVNFPQKPNLGYNPSKEP